MPFSRGHGEDDVDSEVEAARKCKVSAPGSSKDDLSVPAKYGRAKPEGLSIDDNALAEATSEASPRSTLLSWKASLGFIREATFQPDSSRVQKWRHDIVNSLKKPYEKKQQPPSWDSVHTVELHEEAQHHHEAAHRLGVCCRWWWSMQGWVLAIFVGILCYMSYVVIEVGIHACASLRFGFCPPKPLRLEESCPPGHWISWGEGIIGFCASVGLGVPMAMASAWLVVNFAPAAAGSGIPEVKTILNGFVLPDIVTLRTLSIKVPGLILAVGSGLSLGHEGPMVHVAVCWAQFLARIFPQYQNEGKRRELYSAAVAAGVSSAFGTPVGGVLFSLEEVSSHFPSRTLMLAFIASAVATLALSVGGLTGTPGHLTLFSVTYTVTVHPSEYVLFALLGIAGGLVGAAFNAVNIRWNAFRMKPAYKKSLTPVQEVMLISLFTLISSFPLNATRPLNAEAIHAMFDTCSDELEQAGQAESATRGHLQVKLGLCGPSGVYTEANTELLTTLGAAAAIRFFQTALIIGTSCPAGLFVPSLFIGACLGRSVGGSLKALNAGNRFLSHNVDPGVYSMVGAAAVLGGVCRMTISLVVIMLELTGGLDYIVPFMLAVLLAKAVGDTLNEGIYDLYIVLKGYPFIHEELDITFTERCCDIMETRLTRIDISLKPRLRDLKVMLRAFSFRGFPICSGSHFIGYIRRKQLEDLLASLELKRQDDEVVTMEDLFPHTDSTVMRMVPDAPLSQAHQVFKQLGCQIIFVIGSQGPDAMDVLLGIVTKKNFLKFLMDGKVGHFVDNRLSPLADNQNQLRIAFGRPMSKSTASDIVTQELSSVQGSAVSAAQELHSLGIAQDLISTSDEETSSSAVASSHALVTGKRR